MNTISDASSEKDRKSEGNIWPSAPTLLPPPEPPLVPYFQRIPFLRGVGIDLAVGVIAGGILAWRRWALHNPMHWLDIGEGSALIFAFFLCLNILYQRAVLKSKKEAQ